MRITAAILAGMLVFSTIALGQQPSMPPARTNADGTEVINVKMIGARGDGRSDDTKALQEAFRLSFGAGGSRKNIYLPVGKYRVTQELAMYDAANSRLADAGCVIGDGANQTILIWQGPADRAAIRMIGAFQCVRDLGIMAESDWLAGISYDGDPHIGRSTHGSIERVHINCQGYKGDGIDLGRSHYQADMLTIYHPYIERCSLGNGIATWDPNSLSITVVGPTLVRNHVGIRKGTTTNLSVFSGEVDHNDVNFVAGGGGPFNITGIRTEWSKRSYFDNVGSYGQPVTFSNYYVSAINAERPRATATIAAHSTDLLLSEGGYVEGDRIIIVGAGRGGKPLRAKVTGWSDPTHVKIDVPADFGVNGAAMGLYGNCTANVQEGQAAIILSAPCFVEGEKVMLPGQGPNGSNLDTTITTCTTPTRCTLASVPQKTMPAAVVFGSSQSAQFNFEENSLGPYIHMGGYIQGQGAVVLPNGRAAQIFIGNVFGENVRNPFGLPSGAAIPPRALVFGNFANASKQPEPMPDGGSLSGGGLPRN
jgi:hypothetical protein